MGKANRNKPNKRVNRNDTQRTPTHERICKGTAQGR